jgi:hypothetical protein
MSQEARMGKTSRSEEQITNGSISYVNEGTLINQFKEKYLLG